MKRYGIAAVFAAFTVLAIGIYYVQAAGDRNPQFRLATIDGDRREADSLALSGWYLAVPYSERVEISTAGSRYYSELTLFQRLRRELNRNVPAIDRLVRDYPNFMRKERTADYQDDELLVRVNLEPWFKVDASHVKYRFSIDLLDKRTKRPRSFQVDLPDNLPFNSSGVVDVQRVDSALKVAVQYENLRSDGTRDAPEIRVYDIDLSENKITGSATVDYGLVPAKGQELNLNAVRTYDWTMPSDYLVLETSLMEVQEEQETGGSPANAVRASAARKAAVERRLTVYAYKTNRTASIPLPAKQPDDRTRSLLYQIGDDVLQVDVSPETAKIQGYSLGEMKQAYETTLTGNDLQAKTIGDAEIGPNRLYLTMRAADRDRPAVAAIDPANGRIVFRGAVTLDGGDPQDASLSRVNVYSVSQRE